MSDTNNATETIARHAAPTDFETARRQRTRKALTRQRILLRKLRADLDRDLALIDQLHADVELWIEGDGFPESLKRYAQLVLSSRCEGGDKRAVDQLMNELYETYCPKIDGEVQLRMHQAIDEVLPVACGLDQIAGMGNA